MRNRFWHRPVFNVALRLHKLCESLPVFGRKKPDAEALDALFARATQEIARRDKKKAQRLHDPILCKTIYFSDWHIGTASCCAQELIDFIGHVKAEKFILAGDIFDCWKMGGFDVSELLRQNPAQAAIIRILHELPSVGIDGLLAVGNHEGFRDKKVNELPLADLSVTDEIIHDTKDGRRVLILHGDFFDGRVLGNRWLGILGAHAYEGIEAASVLIDDVQKATILRRLFRCLGLRGQWSLAQFVQNTYHEMSYKESFEEKALAHVFDKNANIHARNQARIKNNSPEPPEKFIDEIICGHTHIPARKRVSSPCGENGKSIGPEYVTYSNTGCWMGPTSQPNGDPVAEYPQLKKATPLYNTAIIEHDDGRMEHVQWVIGVGIVPLQPCNNGFFDGSSAKEAYSRMIKTPWGGVFSEAAPVPA